VAASPEDLSFLVQSSERLLTRLREQPGLAVPAETRGGALAHHIRETIAALESAISADTASYALARLPQAKQTLTRNIRLYNALAWSIFDAVPWLTAPRRQLGLGVTYLLDEMALGIVGKEVDVVPVESAPYMYWTYSWPFRWIIEEHLGQTVATDRRPIVVAYPAEEVDSTLLHCALAHELGHPSADANDLVDAVLTPLASATKYKDALDVASRYLESIGIPVSNAREELEGRLDAWTEELLCDQLALAYLGPSFLFAFAAFLLSVTADEPGEDHPPTTLRLQFLTEQAKDAGWDTVVKARAPDIWKWLIQLAKTPLAAADPDVEFALNMCQEAEAEIRRVATDRVGPDRLLPGEFTDQADAIRELLDLRILPVEARIGGGGFATRSVVLAAWFHALHAAGNSPAAISEAVEGQEFQRFVGKALELGVTLNTWNQL
jgi:hypothetical protein